MLNGSAKFQGQYLNIALLTSPDLLQSLFHILLRFRQHKYAVSADIEGVFHQVGVIPKDQPLLRFLWREIIASQIAVDQVDENICHLFGSKNSPTCANNALKRTATDNQADYCEAAKSVYRIFYMDGYIDSSPTIEEVAKKAKDVVKLLERGRLRLTKFVSNVAEVPNDLELTCKPSSIVEKFIPKVLRCGRDFRPDNSGRKELRPIVRQPRRCLYERTASQRPPRQPVAERSSIPPEPRLSIPAVKRAPAKTRADVKTSEQVDIATTAMAAMTATTSTFEWQSTARSRSFAHSGLLVAPPPSKRNIPLRDSNNF